MTAAQCNPAGMKVNPALQRRSVLAWLAGIVFALLFAAAGFWQLSRAHFKDTLSQRYASVATETLPADPTHDVDGMRVGVRGHWLSGHTVWIDNRTHEGRAGVHILTPLQLVDGRWLFVDRGWAALDARRDLPAAPALTQGEVALDGRLAMPAEGFHFGVGPASGKLWPRVDPEAMRLLAAGAPVYPAVLQLEQPAGDGLVRDWAPPVMSGDRHRAYAAQWFSFSAIAFVLVVWAVRRKSSNES
jgi:cytochrome oxidase assembly protein ShyY1